MCNSWSFAEMLMLEEHSVSEKMKHFEKLSDV